MKKGFTLIELLIVIAIIAILTAAVVVVLNPGQMLAQSRDSQRMSDLDAIRSAIQLYQATTSTSAIATATNCTAAGITMTTTGITGAGTTCTQNTLTAVNATGWVKVDLASLSNGSPIANLPIDPSNGTAITVYSSSSASLGTATATYAYASDGSYFELNTILESTKYAPKMSNDGGDQGGSAGGTSATNTRYEVGTSLKLFN